MANQGCGRRAKLVGKAHDDHSGQCGIGADGKIDLAGDNAKRESKSDEAENGEALHDGERRAVGEKELVGEGKIAVDADCQQDGECKVGIADDPTFEPGSQPFVLRCVGHS